MAEAAEWRRDKLDELESGTSCLPAHLVEIISEPLASCAAVETLSWCGDTGKAIRCNSSSAVSVSGGDRIGTAEDADGDKPRRAKAGWKIVALKDTLAEREGVASRMGRFLAHLSKMSGGTSWSTMVGTQGWCGNLDETDKGVPTMGGGSDGISVRIVIDDDDGVSDGDGGDVAIGTELDARQGDEVVTAWSYSLAGVTPWPHIVCSVGLGRGRYKSMWIRNRRCQDRDCGIGAIQ